MQLRRLMVLALGELFTCLILLSLDAACDAEHEPQALTDSGLGQGTQMDIGALYQESYKMPLTWKMFKYP